MSYHEGNNVIKIVLLQVIKHTSIVSYMAIQIQTLYILF